jgi:hypothetical protein
MKDELNKYEEGYKLYILSGGQPVPAPVFYLDHIQDPQVGCHVNCKSCCIQHSDVIPLSDVVPYTSMVPATYRPLLCDSGQIGWRFFEILTPLNCPRKQP